MTTAHLYSDCHFEAINTAVWWLHLLRQRQSLSTEIIVWKLRSHHVKLSVSVWRARCCKKCVQISELCKIRCLKWAELYSFIIQHKQHFFVFSFLDVWSGKWNEQKCLERPISGCYCQYLSHNNIRPSRNKTKNDYSLNMGLITFCIIISDYHCRSSRVTDLTGAQGGFDVSLLIP